MVQVADEMKRRVVVTGMGMVTSLASGVDQCWRKVLDGESGIREIQSIDVQGFRVRIAGDIHDWNPSQLLDTREMKRVDRFTQFALVAGNEAVNDSQIDFSKTDTQRGGSIMGSGVGGLVTIEEQNSRLLAKGPDRVAPMTVPKMMLNAAGANLAIRYGLTGPNYSFATACASANNAMGDALRMIQRGVLDVVLTGGAEATITRMAVSAFQNMRALSERNEEPARASRPFDRTRDGFVLSEGSGVLFFEELEHARRRGARIYAEVFGFGTSCDAGHITQPDEQGRGAARAMQMALEDAGLSPESIDYINAHGTGTPLGDKAETIAVKKVFGDHAYRVNISSTKSQLGHLLGASGGVEMILTIKALCQDLVPPTINLHHPDPECDLNYTPLEPQPRTLAYAMNNSFGFGGHNASLVLGKLRD